MVTTTTSSVPSGAVRAVTACGAALVVPCSVQVVPVSVLTLLFTAGLVISQRPEPLWALMTGTGIGALGAGIISIALTWVQRATGPFAPGPKAD